VESVSGDAARCKRGFHDATFPKDKKGPATAEMCLREVGSLEATQSALEQVTSRNIRTIKPPLKAPTDGVLVFPHQTTSALVKPWPNRFLLFAIWRWNP
jgi:hypothetical protein